MQNKKKNLVPSPDTPEAKLHHEEAFLGIICALILVGVSSFFLLGAEGDYLLETFGFLISVLYWLKA